MLRRSIGMADSSPAMYLVKESRSILMVLVVADLESICNHEHIYVEIDSH